MIRKIYLFLSIILLLPALAYSQNASITGTLFNTLNNEPLPGAHVHLDGSDRGSTTDANGNFSIKGIVAGHYKIKVSYIGYKDYEKEINIAENQTLKLNIAISETTNNLETVNVFGTINKETDAASRSTEKNANNLTNVVGAQAILKSPDLNAANVLTRVSGVTIQRNSGGDEAYAVIRGIEPRYNNTLINGIKITSPDEKSRFISLDVIPSELLQRIEVSKSLTPDMEGDAIGGTVNLIFKDAPDSLLFNANASIGYSALFFSRKYSDFSKKDIQPKSVYDRFGPAYAAVPSDFSKTNEDFKQKTAPPTSTFGFTYGNRFLKNKLGILIADNYQNQFYGSNSQYNPAVPNPQDNFKPYLTNIANRTYSNQQLNNGLVLHADYNINDKNKIIVNNVFLYSSFAQAFLSIDTTLSGGDAGRTIFHGKYVPGTGSIHNNYRSVTNQQYLENLKVEGKHILSNHFLIDWAGAYSYATKKAPDRAEFTLNKLITYDSVTNKNKSTPYYYDGGTRIWQHNEDRDYTGLLNLTYKSHFGNNLIELKAGGLYRHKDRDNQQNQYNVFAPGGNNSIGSRQQFTDIYSTRDSIINPNGTAGYDLNNYHAFENITAGYGEFKLVLPKLDIIGGARLENTSQGYHYLQFVQDAVDNVTKTYTDILPSLQLKYHLNDKTNIRASYFKSLARPNYYELIPYQINGNNGYSEVGNPNLQHATADNFDLRYELYPKPDQQLFIGGFYKKLQNPIENAFIQRYGGTQLIFTPTNIAPDATIYGGELVYSKYFGSFGITGNYAYTHSDVDASKIDPTKYDMDAQGNPVPHRVLQHRPLQGQADNEFNLSVEYKSDKRKLFVQLAYQYVGKTLAIVYPNVGYDYYQQPQSFLSLSADKELNRHFTIFGKFNNLLNTPTTIKIDNLVTGRDISKASGIIGLRYSR
jgi:TonB-dependent receptor